MRLAMRGARTHTFVVWQRGEDLQCIASKAIGAAEWDVRLIHRSRVVSRGMFPPGSLEGAPAFFALVTRSGSAEKSAELQRSIVQKFPNVSVIDFT